jgi:hypothetical protein
VPSYLYTWIMNKSDITSCGWWQSEQARLSNQLDAATL